MKSDEQILAELRASSEGLFYMSESDYPFETVRWDGTAELSPEYLRAASGEAANARVEVRSLDDFFRVATSEASWKREPELALAKRFQNLVRVLRENLADVKAHRIGKTNMAVYVVGKSPSGNWLGVSTRVVET